MHQQKSNEKIPNLTIPQLPGHHILPGLTVLQQQFCICAVPCVFAGSEQSIQTEDEVQTRAVRKTIQQIDCIFCKKQTLDILSFIMISENLNILLGSIKMMAQSLYTYGYHIVAIVYSCHAVFLKRRLFIKNSTLYFLILKSVGQRNLHYCQRTLFCGTDSIR